MSRAKCIEEKLLTGKSIKKAESKNVIDLKKPPDYLDRPAKRIYLSIVRL